MHGVVYTQLREASWVRGRKRAVRVSCAGHVGSLPDARPKIYGFFGKRMCRGNGPSSLEESPSPNTNRGVLNDYAEQAV